MAGNKIGGQKAAAKNRANDPDFYAKIGAKGGKNGCVVVPCCIHMQAKYDFEVLWASRAMILEVFHFWSRLLQL